LVLLDALSTDRGVNHTKRNRLSGRGEISTSFDPEVGDFLTKVPARCTKVHETTGLVITRHLRTRSSKSSHPRIAHDTVSISAVADHTPHVVILAARQNALQRVVAVKAVPKGKPHVGLTAAVPHVAERNVRDRSSPVLRVSNV
jgi:hypothetical protein